MPKRVCENNMKYDLAQKVLMVDKVPEENLARYEFGPELGIPLIYNPNNHEIVETQNSTEVLAPLTTEDTNWDKVLIEILLKCVNNEDSSRNKTVSDFADHFNWLDIDAFFCDNEVMCTQVIIHTSQNCDLSSLDVHQSEYCPQNVAFFLPPPHFLGALATKKDKHEMGIVVINTNLVVKVNLTAV